MQCLLFVWIVKLRDCVTADIRTGLSSVWTLLSYCSSAVSGSVCRNWGLFVNWIAWSGLPSKEQGLSKYFFVVIPARSGATAISLFVFVLLPGNDHHIA